MRPNLRIVRAACALALLLAGSVRASGPAASVPSGFDDQLVASVPWPTALAFTPDGRMLITSQTGQVWVYQDGALLGAPALDLAAEGKLCSNSERGLLGVAVDPAFADNRAIYLYYTFNKHATCEINTARSPVNRVARYTLSDANQASGEALLIDNIPSPNGNHNAGDLRFGKDGYLYVSVGDGGCDYADKTRCAAGNDAARDQFTLLGKILRITRDGDIPPGNPWVGDDSARCAATGRAEAGKKCQETFAWGLRNPFRMAFDPDAAGTRFFINDVGQNAWEEIDEGQAGADYGWNVREGRCATGSTIDCGPPPAGMTNPIHDYGRSNGCNSITGGAFVPSGVWPADYDGDYLFGDYGCGRIFRLERSGGGYARSTFATTSSVTSLAFGPYGAAQALYYTTYTASPTGEVRRISAAAAANRTPAAALRAAPASGPAPLEVTLDGSASSDPDGGDTLTYLWDFGDQSAPRETAAATVAHTYAATGTFTATLRVRDSHGATSAPATARIDSGNRAPAPRISAPAQDARFRVGQTIALIGSASDPEDGPLPEARLTWQVTLHHNEHTHPYLAPTVGNGIAISAPAPEDLDATSASYLEIALTATDSRGLSATITQTLQPQRVDIGFASAPSGLTLIINDTPIVTPRTLVSWEGYALRAVAPTQPDGAGGWLRAERWSDGGGPIHLIGTPSAPVTYTATFTPTRPMLLPLARR